MSDPKDESYKVSDRRKFNADGTPREPEADRIVVPTASELPLESAESADSVPAEPAGASGNVVSFPGNGPKKPDSDSAASPIVEDSRDRSPQREADEAYHDATRSRGSRLPEASFLSLANMLGVEAAMHLGLIQTAAGEKPSIDLEAARHMIDLLGVLYDKTQGNLTSEEDSLLDNMLADLRMQFVAATRGR